MPFVGIDPDKARDLSTTLRHAAGDADVLSGEVTAALTLSAMEAPAPGQLLLASDELEQVGVVVAARADIAEGFVIDPATLAADLGITVPKAEAAVAALEDPEANANELTPFLDALGERKFAAEVLRQSFTGLPELGEDGEVDQLLYRLGAWLPEALSSGELPDLAPEQAQDLFLLGVALDLDQLIVHAGSHVTGIPPVDGAEGTSPFLQLSSNSALEQVLRGDGPSNGTNLAAYGDSPEAVQLLFAQIAKAFELDGRLTKAAGLPTIRDLFRQFDIDVEGDHTYADRWDALDEWLPAFLAGEGGVPDDPQAQALAISLAGHTGWQGGEGWGADNFVNLSAEDQARHFDSAMAHLKGNRLLQKALIPGDFEAIDGPVLIWTEGGVQSALLAGQRNGALTAETLEVAGQVADAVLTNPDGTDDPIELSVEQQQALVAAVVAQNGADFVGESPNIQRQLVQALSLIGRQSTLTLQRELFAKSIEAFRSLAVVGSPAVTYGQLEEIVGSEVAEELSYKDLVARSASRTEKRPFLLTLATHWGIPGGDTIKTKKRKFSFDFDETGALVNVRKKKISKWKRFKNTLKAFGKALWSEWKDNPWKYLFLGPAGLMPGANQLAEGVEDGDFDDIVEGGWEMTKFAATIAATVFPPSSAAGAAALAVMVVDTVDAIRDGDWLGALGNAFSFAGGAASFFGDVAAVGSTANLVSRGAKVAENVVTAIDTGDDLIEAIEDGDIAGAIGSGFGFAGSVATVVSSGSEFANSVGQRLGDNGVLDGQTLAQLRSNPLVNQQLLEDTFTNPLVSSGTIETINEIGQTAGQLSGITTGVDTTIGAIEDGNVAGAIAGGFETLGSVSTLIGDSGGIVDDAIGLDPVTGEQLVDFGTGTATRLATGTRIAGSVIDGDEIGVLEGAVRFGQIGLDPDSRLAGQLDVADEALDVARLGEQVYNGGAVPDFATLVTELGQVGAAAATIPDAPEPPPPPPLPGPVDGSDPTILLASQTRGGVPPSPTDGGAPTFEQVALSQGYSADGRTKLLDVSHNPGATGEHVIVTIGGAGDDWLHQDGNRPVGDHLRHRVQQDFPDAHVGYVTSHHRADAFEWVRQYREQNPGAHVTLVGHSWGGAEAARLAADLDGHDINVDVVTLDPVSRLSDLPRSGNVEEWINVADKGIDVFPDDLIAWLGGHVGRDTLADTNFDVETSHGNAAGMYESLSPFIPQPDETHLRPGPFRPSPPRPPDLLDGPSETGSDQSLLLDGANSIVVPAFAATRGVEASGDGPDPLLAIREAGSPAPLGPLPAGEVAKPILPSPPRPGPAGPPIDPPTLEHHVSHQAILGDEEAPLPVGIDPVGTVLSREPGAMDGEWGFKGKLFGGTKIGPPAGAEGQSLKATGAAEAEEVNIHGPNGLISERVRKGNSGTVSFDAQVADFSHTVGTGTESLTTTGENFTQTGTGTYEREATEVGVKAGRVLRFGAGSSHQVKDLDIEGQRTNTDGSHTEISGTGNASSTAVHVNAGGEGRFGPFSASAKVEAGRTVSNQEYDRVYTNEDGSKIHVEGEQEKVAYGLSGGLKGKAELGTKLSGGGEIEGTLGSSILTGVRIEETRTEVDASGQVRAGSELSKDATLFASSEETSDREYDQAGNLTAAGRSHEVEIPFHGASGSDRTTYNPDGTMATRESNVTFQTPLFDSTADSKIDYGQSGAKDRSTMTSTWDGVFVDESNRVSNHYGDDGQLEDSLQHTESVGPFRSEQQSTYKVFNPDGTVKGELTMRTTDGRFGTPETTLELNGAELNEDDVTAPKLADERGGSGQRSSD